MPHPCFKNRAERIAKLRETISDLRAAGLTTTQIASTLNMAWQGVSYHIKQMDKKNAGRPDAR